MENINSEKSLTYIIKEASKIAFGDMSANILLCLTCILLLIGESAINNIQIIEGVPSTMNLWMLITSFAAIMMGMIAFVGWAILLKLNTMNYNFKNKLY